MDSDLIEQEAVRQYRLIMAVTWKSMQRRVAYFEECPEEMDDTTKEMGRQLKIIEKRGWLAPVEPLTRE